MKINRHNTALHFLEERDPLKFNVSAWKGSTEIEALALSERVKDAWPTLQKRVLKGKIRYITDPFERAYDSAKDRLTLNFRRDTIQESGAFIFRCAGGEGKNTIFYSIDCHPVKKPEDVPPGVYSLDEFKAEIPEPGEEKGDYVIKGSVICFCCLKNESKPALFGAYFMDRQGHQTDWFCNKDNEGKKRGGGFEIFMDMVFMCLFLRYCEIETKVIEPGRKGAHAEHKYLNETKSPVEIIDSTWFTTIIRSEGFGVKGHFRLQPYGPGLAQKKLIYIMPFEKHGYTRKAKILTERTEDETEGHRTPGGVGEN